MVAMSCYAIVIGIYAHQADSYCNYLDTQIFVYTMTVIALLRCHHVIMMVLFLFCWILLLMPCLFCCPENCCVKWLTIRSAKAPKSVITKLKSQWSWQFLPLDDCSTKNLQGDALLAARTL